MNNKAVIGSYNVKNYADLGGCSVALVDPGSPRSA